MEVLRKQLHKELPERPPRSIKSTTQLWLADGQRTLIQQTLQRKHFDKHGLVISKQIREHDVFAAECGDLEHPKGVKCKTVILLAIETAHTVEQQTREHRHNWLGEVRSGDVVIKAVLMVHSDGNPEYIYIETGKVVFVPVEDCRQRLRAEQFSETKYTVPRGNEMSAYQINLQDLDDVEELKLIPGFKQKRQVIPTTGGRLRRAAGELNHKEVELKNAYHLAR